MDGNVRKLGQEKLTYFEKNFDLVYDEYKMKAQNEGYEGKILFKKERGKMIVFVELEK
jgi:hypothetical protein